MLFFRGHRADSESYQYPYYSLSSILALWSLFLWPHLCTLNFPILKCILLQDPINVARALNFIYILVKNSLRQKSMGIILDRRAFGYTLYIMPYSGYLVFKAFSEMQHLFHRLFKTFFDIRHCGCLT